MCAAGFSENMFHDSLMLKLHIATVELLQRWSMSRKGRGRNLWGLQRSSSNKVLTLCAHQFFLYGLYRPN